MSDYKELVRRLRDLDTCDERGSFTTCPVGQGAADAIEKLSAEVERLNGYILAMHTDVVTPLRAGVERLKQELAEAREKWRIK